ncbi:MAG TPA: hypothetical protein VKR55_11770 [Bradyrhizobium sp.]|uniref:putative quinol monooxygenase n=1 Tax=Bradyrhizobium sp. TaxID=376 RepID=UPI002C9B7527|nr:hypothetical protein [Bradyrhizobium sp.]HLZ02815.1 hypothetical protein [Bradyrhizobium sp.]
MSDELVIFARFHATEGKDSALETELHSITTITRSEPDCLFIEIYRSVRDARIKVPRSRIVVDRTRFVRQAAPARTRPGGCNLPSVRWIDRCMRRNAKANAAISSSCMKASASPAPLQAESLLL